MSTLLKSLIQKACQFTWDYPQASAEYRISTVIIDEINQAPTQHYHLPLSDSAILHKIRDYILEHLHEKLNSQHIANHHGISAKTLNRLCQKNIGMTFDQWRQQIKLLHAIQLLCQGASTTTVAQALGYSNDSAFIHRFKQLTGKTPTEFIRSNTS